MGFDPISYDKAEKARKHSKNVQEQLNQAIAAGEQLVETQQARVDDTGVIHPTLNERITSDVTKLKNKNDEIVSQLAAIAQKPKLTLNQVVSISGNTFITFSAFYHAFDFVNKTPTDIYAIKTASTAYQYQSIYKSIDNGNNWTKIGDISLDVLGGERLERIAVEKWTNTIIILKSFPTSPKTYEVNTYDGTTLALLGSLDIGTASWHAATHNIDCGSLHGSNAHCIMFAEYTFTGATETSLNVWKTINRGVTWTSVFTQDVNDVTGIRHFHTLQCDPYTKDWWLSSGDGDAETKIWRSQDDGATWTLLFSGSQQYRTLSFVFEQDYVYWGMDSPSYNVDTNIYRVHKTTLVQELVATTYNYQAIYGLTRTFYPEGILVWLVNEVADTHTGLYKIQFYSYKDKKLYDVAELDSSALSNAYGFREASRYQSINDGSIFAYSGNFYNVYLGNSSTRSPVMRCKLNL